MSAARGGQGSGGREDRREAPLEDLYEVMRCAPTTRHFRSDPVPGEAIGRALDHARFAPSGGNRQPWRVVVVDDPELRARIGELYLPHWERYVERMGARGVLEQARAGEGAEAARVRPGRRAGLVGADDYARRLGQIPIHLVVCADLGALAIVDRDLDRPSIVGGASIYPFVQNVLLGLRREGLGAALTTLLTPAEAEVSELLGLPEDVAVAAHIGVGYRDGGWPRLSRRPVSDFAFANRYGEPWRDQP